MADYPYALDLDLTDSSGRKVGMFHVRANGAADFIAELAEIDAGFATHLGNAVSAVRAFSLLSSELGAVPVAGGNDAPAPWSPTPAAPPTAEGWPTAPPEPDPWQTPAPTQWQTPAPPAPAGPPTAPAAPVCNHGPMRYVPAGTSKAGKPYPAFWGCTAAQGDPSRCKSKPAS
ncbi:hypothetical protein GCM10010466_29710 [Planomonospora alba]|uniref:Uncharacterized protein n=1 Tax=Planomonospora alba TaxID=161354 RepID=A0ABP6N5C4_9ACTN